MNEAQFVLLSASNTKQRTQMKFRTIAPFVLSIIVLQTGCKTSEIVDGQMPELSIVDTIIEEHIVARGGMDALGNIKSLRVEGSAEMP